MAAYQLPKRRRIYLMRHGDVTYFDDSGRTIETAQRVLAETGQQIELEIEPAWQEIRGGKLRQIPLQDLEAAFLGVFDGIVPESTRFLDGETIGELFDRVVPAVAALREDSSWDTVLLVLHGGVNRAILSHALTAGGRTFFGHLAQATGCINALDVGIAPRDWGLRAINYSPPSPLHRDIRNTTMEILYAQFIQSTRS